MTMTAAPAADQTVSAQYTPPATPVIVQNIIQPMIVYNGYLLGIKPHCSSGAS